jgi:Ca-activated chloride channel family protein
VLFRKSLVPFVVKKRYGIRRNKIFILTFYTTIGGVIFFQFLLESKKGIWDLELIKKLSPDRSVFKPIFKLVVILLVLQD